MGASIYNRLKELEAFRDEVLSGAYPQRTVLGPGAINKNFIKAKSITGSMLDVSELSAVASKTGSLSVTGDLIAGSGASTLGYSPTNGLYIGGATPAASPFKVGTNGALEATGATIGGSISASSLTANTSGQIAGWTIDSAKLSRGNVGIGDSSGYRIWSGNLSSPSLANFSVDNSGNIKAAAGTIAGMTVDSQRMTVNNAGMGSYGGYNLWVGNSTPSSAPFRVDTVGNMVSQQANITGAVTASSGSFTGSVTTSSLDANGGTLGGLTIDGTLTVSTSGSIRSGKTSYGSGTGWLLEYNGGTPRLDIGSSSAYLRWSGSALTVKGRLEFGTGSYIESDQIVVDASASTSLTFKNSGTSYMTAGVLAATGYIQTANGADLFLASSGFLVASAITSIQVRPGDYSGTYTFSVADSVGATQWSCNTDGLVNFATAPASNPGNTNWSSRGFSADGGGYFKVQIGGTTYRIPVYADA